MCWLERKSSSVQNSKIINAKNFLFATDQGVAKSTNIVQEKIKVAKQIAEECCKEYVSVTYDLAIAKIGFTSKDRIPYSKTYSSRLERFMYIRPSLRESES